jgi:amino acid transporter
MGPTALLAHCMVELGGADYGRARSPTRNYEFRDCHSPDCIYRPCSVVRETVCVCHHHCRAISILKWYFRFTVFSATLLFVLYWIWLPVKASGKFHPENFNTFYNGINLGEEKQASDAYCWVVAILFGPWEFYGYDASVHLAEETNSASEVVATGMWTGTLATWILSVPTLMLFIFCMQDFMAVAGGHTPITSPSFPFRSSARTVL